MPIRFFLLPPLFALTGYLVTRLTRLTQPCSHLGLLYTIPTLLSALFGLSCSFWADSDIRILQALLLMAIGLHASLQDLDCRLVSDFHAAALFLLAVPTLERLGWTLFLPPILSLFCLFLLTLLASPGSLGGADLKCSLALCALVGGLPGFLTPLLGLMLAVLYAGLSRLTGHPIRSLPLLPFLTLAGLLLFLF